MLPRSQSENFSNGRPKKKPAPPRPPQPRLATLQNTQSFRTTADGKTFQRSMSIGTGSGRPTGGNDLIDFSTPPSTPPGTSFMPKQNEFMYRVGASIFYIKSPLKNTSVETPSAHPFSPPRPSPQSLLSTPTKSADGHKKTISSTTNSSIKPTPTIIRMNNGGSASSISKPNTGTSATNQSNNNTWNANVPLVWDEPPKKTPPAIAPKPTIIRPSPATSITSTQPTRNYYDEPPENTEDSNDEFDGGDSFASPPMPNEPPPPPPADLEDDTWPDEEPTAAYSEPYTDPYMTTDGEGPYAIVLYDFTPETEGDLALQAGNLVYLTKKIDDSWMYGICDGVAGIFPTNYVNIQVPLPAEEEHDVQVPEINSTETETSSTNQKFFYANVLYQFKAETENDLNLEPGDVVTIWGRINDDWLYGTINRQHGQFPASFVDSVPDDLPTIEA